MRVTYRNNMEKMLLHCDWLISVQLSSNRSANLCNNSAKIYNKLI
jgi:hypothetical protein